MEKLSPVIIKQRRASISNFEQLAQITSNHLKLYNSGFTEFYARNKLEYNLIKEISKVKHFLSNNSLYERTVLKYENLKLDNLEDSTEHNNQNNYKHSNKNNNEILNNKNLISNLFKKFHSNSIIVKSKNKIYLSLKNLKGKLLLEDLIINPLGLANNKSKRNEKDTLTFFGYSYCKNYNDYILNNTSYIYNNKTFTKTLFAIIYEPSCFKYFIQPIVDKDKDGRFILIKIPHNRIYFIKCKVVLLNKNIIYIKTSQNKVSNYKYNIEYNLQINIYPKDENEPSTFDFANIDKQKINIGYNKDCTITLNEEGVDENYFCEIVFDREKELWEIYGKGIWFLLDQKISINKEMHLKIGDEIIVIKELKK